MPRQASASASPSASAAAATSAVTSASASASKSFRYSISQRVSVLVLHVEGLSWQAIEQKTGVKQTAQSYIRKKAKQRGFRPEIDPQVLDKYVIDSKPSGRPKEISEDTEQQLLANV
ncbi:hypothetical protein GJ744_011547 [Endocarpon pusillum]|uniref:Uncharacterized protein n=1 Tax=Endocarpon pusillum TaxID=364733 RepID=A0A8H7AK77_9EURO|nr:hypothetical protein GJ744_011547 [Endocarpon pusillum]